MTSCERTRNSLSDYVEGLLDVEKLNTVKSHVQQCPSCARVCERTKMVRELLGDLSDIAPSSAFEHTLREKLRLERERSQRRWWSRAPSLVPLRPWPAFAISMTCIAIAAGLFLFRDIFFQQKQPIFLAQSENGTRLERVSAPVESTSFHTPVRFVRDTDAAPNYVLRRISPQFLEWHREYLSSSWDSNFNREYILGWTRIQWTSEGRPIEYVLPSAHPSLKVQTATFHP